MNSVEIGEERKASLSKPLLCKNTVGNIKKEVCLNFMLVQNANNKKPAFRICQFVK